MNTIEAVKHSGANWVSHKYSLSPLGVKVANVLGQVGLGIYHYADYLEGRNAPQWNERNVITVVLRRELATFDGMELTMLLLCCHAADIRVAFRGRRSGYLALDFFNGADEIPEPSSGLLNEATSIDEFIQHLGFKPKLKGAFKWSRERERFIKDGRVDLVFISIPNDCLLSCSGALSQLVVDAHQACIRVAVGGLTHQSMEFRFFKRQQRNGPFWNRHPNWETHRETLRPYWSIDFDSLN